MAVHGGQHRQRSAGNRDCRLETAHQMLRAAAQPAEDSAGEAADSAARSLTEVATRLAHRDGTKNDQRTATIAQWVEQAAAQLPMHRSKPSCQSW